MPVRKKLSYSSQYEQHRALPMILSVTGHNSMSEWRRSARYQELADSVIASRTECSCCHDLTSKTFNTRFTEDDITGRDLHHWRPLCEYHYHYIKVKACSYAGEIDLFYAMRQAKRASLVAS